jgi:hypothetical protein
VIIEVREPDRTMRRNHLFVFILFVFLTLLMTWPVIARLGSHLAGGRDDLWVHQWTFWWVREALYQGQNPFFTPYLYSPIGASLTSHNIAWFNIALWLPLQAFFGRIPAYNLVFLAVVFLNGFCMYLFAWEVFLANRMQANGAALISGIIFGFWPYTLSHYDHANMMVVFWVPLTLLLLQRLILATMQEKGEQAQKFQWWLILGAALSLAMIGITRWQLLIMSSPILVGYTIFLMWAFPAARNRTTLIELLIVSGIAVIVMAPLAAPLVADQFTREFPEDVFLDEAVWGRTDLLAYFVPSIHNGIWQERVAPIYERFVVNQFYTPYLGFLTLLMSVVGVVRRWRQTWIWLFLALLYIILALGPELAVNGRAYPAIPMPYRLVEDFFLLRMIRRPDRLNIFLSLPLAMLAGWGAQAILGKISNRTVRRLAFSAAVLLVLLAYNPVPFATTAPETPQWLAQRGMEDEDFGTLDIPINDRSYDKWYMQYQTDHGLPIATGHVSRLPRESTTFLDSVPFLANLKENDQIPDPSVSNVGQQLNLLSNAGIKYLIVHKRFANEGLQAIWRDWLIVNPTYEDDELLVFNTSLTAGKDFEFIHDLSGDIGLVKANYAPAEGIQGGIIKVDSVWGTKASPQHDLDVCLALINNEKKTITRVCQAPDDQMQTSGWPANDLRRASYLLPVPNEVDPGNYKLVVALSDPVSGEQVGDTAVLGSMVIYPFMPEIVTAVRWQNGIHLLGFDVQENDRNLDITLYWQAVQPLKNSYKTFLHFQNIDSGKIVAQSDTIPRNWTYPTTEWENGEIVRDVISIPMTSLPQGTYNIVIGLYDELSGERLPLSTPTGGQGDSYELTTWEY